MQRTADLSEKLIEIRFPYDVTDVTRMRQLELSSPKFNKGPNGNDPRWYAVCCLKNVYQLRDWGFILGWDLEDWETQATCSKETAKLEWTGALAALYPFQKEGTAWLQQRNGCALLADEMGLGKTVQALAWLSMNEQAEPAVVVCPSSLKINWQREAKFWLGVDAHVINGRKQYQLPPASIYILNYAIIRRETKMVVVKGKRTRQEVPGTGWGDWIAKQIQPPALIIDEAHRLTDPKSLQTRAVTRLSTKAEHTIGLSGTPILNRPMDLHTILRLVDPNRFSNRWDYLMKYCGAKVGYGGHWDFKGATNTSELHEKLTGPDGCMLRRLKANVLPELPAKRTVLVPFELKNSAEYRRASEDFNAWLLEQGSAPSKNVALAKIEKLKQLAVAGKIDACMEWIEELLLTGEKLVLFCHHKSVVNLLVDRFDKYCVVVNGSSNNTKRMLAVDRFQKKPTCQLFIGTKAAIEGLTLTAASNVAFLEFWWTPSEHDQGTDRVHRISQMESVTCWYLIAANSIEEEIAQMLSSKSKVIGAILDGEAVETTDLLSELLVSLKSSVAIY